MRRPTALAAPFLAATAATLLLAACGASTGTSSWDPYDLSHTPTHAQPQAIATGSATSLDRAVVSESTQSGGRSRREARNSAPVQPSPTPPRAEAAPSSGLAPDQTVVASTEEAPPLDQSDDGGLPLLIYTGQVTLAIYDVDATKEAAVALAEELGGYAAQRTDHALVLRVPAERFRPMLDRIEELGDVLSLTWDAQDVTDQFNDLDVRIRNARQMRERLELLLGRAENVSDALSIERELERVTLEIERLEGQRRQMADRIAFATITISFSRLPTANLPGDEYRLPFQWLNQLGVERLLNL